MHMQSLHDIEISTTEVFEILSTLDVNKAPGIDGISPAGCVKILCVSTVGPIMSPVYMQYLKCRVGFQYNGVPIVSFQFINLVTKHT